MLKSTIFLVAFVVAIGSAAKLPKYFKQCTVDDTLNDCILRNVQNSMKNIGFSGGKESKWSNFDPMKIPHVYLQVTPELKASLNDVYFRGLSSSKIEDINMNLDDRTLNMKLNLDFFEMTGQYDIQGRLLNVPLQGSGTFNGTGVGMTSTYSVKLDTIDKDGKKYFKAVADELDMDLDRLHYGLDNLFNGDVRLGTEVNRFLNDNWRAVFEEVKGTLSNLISTLITSIVNSYLTRIPIGDLLN